MVTFLLTHSIAFGSNLSKVCIQLIAAIKKHIDVNRNREGMHRFLGFRQPLRGPTHRFLAVGTTVTRRLHGRYRVSGFREGSGKGLKGGHKG
jgi:hypothetical protein